MKYIFVGNRSHVLKKMISLGCCVNEIFVVADSFLHKDVLKFGLSHKVIHSKKQLIYDIKNLKYDSLVSNGCPYILPISSLDNGKRLFINIHPSLLPDLKGKHPINGALLYERPHGVTCHIMDDNIDTGPIITSIKIPISTFDIPLIYQLSFIAEAQVFELAYLKNFVPLPIKEDQSNPIYYSRSKQDMIITKEDDLSLILTKIRAFGIPSLCARFSRGNIVIKIISAQVFTDSILLTLFPNAKHDEILLIYSDFVLVRFSDCFLHLKILDNYDFTIGEKFFDFI